MTSKNTNITVPKVASFTSISNENTIVITDENVFKLHLKKFKNFTTIVIKAGEEHKNQTTVNSIIKKLIKLSANRATTLIGVGGGVITDITGYVASIYMRGIDFGFVPTTLLALVDASIGGKNGVDVGIYKNMIGTINQPKFILHDLSFLNTLPKTEWQNGFAEIIKHACIKDALMFNELQSHSLKYYLSRKKELSLLIQKNANIKTSIVTNDLFEKGERKLLNFGHTLGHAIENQYKLSHGEAISIGMVFACKLSQQILGFNDTESVANLLNKYGLPTSLNFKKNKAFNVLIKDKKREEGFINYILLESIGSAKIVEIELQKIKLLL